MNESNNFNQGQGTNSEPQLSNTQNVDGNDMNTVTNQSMFNNSVSPAVEGSKSPKNKVMIIALIAAILIIIVLLCLLVFKKDGKLTPPTEIIPNEDKTKENIKYSDNIKHEEKAIELYGQKYIILELENSNNDNVWCEVSIELYDENNNLLDTVNEYLSHFEAKQKAKLIAKSYKVDDFASYKVFVDAKKLYSNFKSFMDSVEVKKSDNGKVYSVQLFNKSDETINIDAKVIFYKNEEIVYVDSIFANDLLPGRSENESYNYLEGYRKFKFDKCEVVINAAYSDIENQ